MTNEEIQKTITDVLVADFECDREKITLDTNLFTELDLDSIDAVDLVRTSAKSARCATSWRPFPSS